MIAPFFQRGKCSTAGAITTDLDGTTVHEYGGMTIIHKEVEVGLKKV